MNMSTMKFLLPILISSLLLGTSEGQLQGLVKTIQGTGDKTISLVSSPAVVASSAVAGPVKAVAEPAKGAGKAIAVPVEKTVSAVATPVEKAIVSTTLRNCDAFKAILGVTYEQLDNKDPDVTKLTLDFWRGIQKDTFNITDDGISRFLRSKNIDHRPISIFLHGFLSSSESDAALEVTKALIKTVADRRTVLALDSSSLIKYFYLRSSTCVRFVGQELGAKLVELYKDGLAPEDIHIIGHSLGSHIAGFAGKSFYEFTGKKIGRISGLDPAGPCFFQEQQELRLSKEDADFVDVIHTDAGVFGIVDPLGHVDFYPNGGEEQPGCAIPPCSHSRAWQLYSESVSAPDSFLGVKCSGWDTYKSGSCSDGDTALMGYGADPSARGVYYMTTNREPPYGMGAKVLTTTAKNFIKKLFSKK